jgi:hypothetical protein
MVKAGKLTPVYGEKTSFGKLSVWFDLNVAGQ